MPPVLVLAFVLMLAAETPAGVHLTATTGLPAIVPAGGAAAAGDGVLDQWFSGRQAAANTRHSGLIVDFERKLAYLVNHDERYFVEMALPLEFRNNQPRSRMLPPTAERLEGRLSLPEEPAGDNTLRLARTKETARIGTWTCTRYDLMLLQPNGRVAIGKLWATTDIPKGVVAATARARPVLLQTQLRLAKASLRSLARIRGVVVAIEWTSGVPGAVQVTDIREEAPPSGTFQPPRGYARRPLLPSNFSWR